MSDQVTNMHPYVATLSYVFQEFQYNSWITKYISCSLKNHSKLCISKHSKTKFKPLLYVVFMHGWLFQTELYGVWFLLVAHLFSSPCWNGTYARVIKAKGILVILRSLRSKDCHLHLQIFWWAFIPCNLVMSGWIRD